jgi:CBS domain containing-hemolysin-like protein
MIPIDKLYMLDLDAEVNIELLDVIRSYNFSTVAVYHGDRTRILGVFRIKQLLGADVDSKKRLRDCVKIDPVIFVHEGRNLLELFDLLKEKKNRFCFVLKKEQKGKNKYFTFFEQPQGRQPIGMVNLKRIFEQIVLREFGDADKQKQILSGEFTKHLTVKKNK